MLRNVLVQGIGYIGLMFVVLSFQKKERKNILFYHLLSSFFYTIHFWFLGAYTGSVMNFFGAARSYVFFKREEKPWADKKMWLYVFLAIISAGGIFTWQGNLSLLPLVSMLAGTVSSWVKDAKLIRIVFLATRPLWFIYNLISGSWPGMITEIILTASILIGIFRHDLSKKQIKCSSD